MASRLQNWERRLPSVWKQLSAVDLSPLTTSYTSEETRNAHCTYVEDSFKKMDNGKIIRTGWDFIVTILNSTQLRVTDKTHLQTHYPILQSLRDTEICGFTKYTFLGKDRDCNTEWRTYKLYLHLLLPSASPGLNQNESNTNNDNMIGQKDYPLLHKSCRLQILSHVSYRV